ncbi:hypothetical protein BJ741DRAFT_615723 [Chytriomyces cf. hyalinus JEL632]|nr:hypothetical protein BJ741DRAFT_615723 [Chytriomyces cf. hyalinus JEL632]
MIDGRAALSGNREGSGWSSGGASALLNASGVPGTLDTLTTSNTATTSNTSTTSSNGASQHAHQLLQIACASACRSTGFDAATPAAVALFAEVAAARLAGLARAAAAASVFTGVASMKPESAPSTSSSYFQSSSHSQSESHSTANPHSLSHSSNSLACSNSVSSHSSSLLLLMSCTRTSGSSALLGADADLLDTDALLALRRLVLAGALTASVASGAEKERDKEKERDSDREKAATLPLPSIPLVSLDIFPRVKPVSFPVPTPVAPLSISLHSSVPANQSHLPSPTLSSSLDTATSIEQKSSDSHLQPPKSSHLPVNASATAAAGVHNDSLNEVQTGEDNLNDSDSESDLASEDEDEDNSNPPAATAAARKQSRQESSSSRRKNRKGRSSRSSRVHHPYLLPVDLKEGIPTIDGTLQAHFKENPSLPSFLTSTTSGSQSSDSVHRKMFTAIPIPFKNYPNDASSSSSSKPVSLPPTKPPATSRDLHQHALRTLLHPSAAPTTTFLSSNANMQHSLGASLSERQMLLRGTAVTLGAGVGASGGGGEGSGGVESLWGYAGVGGGGGGGGLLEGLMNSKGLSVKTHQSVFAGPTAAASSMVGGPSDGQGIKSGGMASNSTSGGNSTGGSGMIMGGGSILGGIGTDLMRNNSLLGNSSGGSPNILPGGAKGGLGSGMQRTQALPLGYQMSGSSGSGIGRMGGIGGGVGPGANGGASLGSGATSFGGGGAGGGGGAESGGSSSGNTGGTKIKFKLSVNK